MNSLFRPVPESLPPELAEALSSARQQMGRLGKRDLYFSTIDSTNDVATALASSDSSEGIVVIADAQTAGRGRLGRSWFSPPASGLYVSVILEPSRSTASPDRATAMTTLAAAVALAEAVESVTGLKPEIKWPNDLMVNRRKLAGVLAEAVTTPGTSNTISSVVLGCGLNIRQMAYPPELANRATSLESELGRPTDCAAICAAVLCALARRYDDLLAGRFDAILDAWRERAPAVRGARVSWDVPSGPRQGLTAGIDEYGRLLVRVGDQFERLVGGEVRWL